MKALKLAAALVLACSASANALTWTWSTNSGTEAGTITTDGDALNGAAGTYTFTGFTWDTSSLLDTSLITGSFIVDDGGAQTMIWDGSSATSFTRNNGANINGSIFAVAGANIGEFSNIRIIFDTGVTVIGDFDYQPYNIFAAADIAVSAAAPGAAVPLPAALPLALAGFGALGMASRRKA
ncbi:MAG: PEP-CTERM sorting domain-containing protein [Mangrovicoccus sp.]